MRSSGTVGAQCASRLSRADFGVGRSWLFKLEVGSHLLLPHSGSQPQGLRGRGGKSTRDVRNTFRSKQKQTVTFGVSLELVCIPELLHEAFKKKHFNYRMFSCYKRLTLTRCPVFKFLLKSFTHVKKRLSLALAHTCVCLPSR